MSSLLFFITLIFFFFVCDTRNSLSININFIHSEVKKHSHAYTHTHTYHLQYQFALSTFLLPSRKIPQNCVKCTLFSLCHSFYFVCIFALTFILNITIPRVRSSSGLFFLSLLFPLFTTTFYVSSRVCVTNDQLWNNVFAVNKYRAPSRLLSFASPHLQHCMSSFPHVFSLHFYLYFVRIYLWMLVCGVQNFWIQIMCSVLFFSSSSASRRQIER